MYPLEEPTMPDPAAILPARPLHARPPGGGLASTIWSFAGFAMFVGFLAFLAAWVGPEIVTDWQVRDTAVPFKGARLEKGSCSSKLFVHICDADLSAPGPNGRITRSTHFIFASFHLGDFEARVVGDPAHREWLTTDLALESFWDRVITFVVATALLTFFVVAFLWQRIKAWQSQAAWRQADVRAIPLQLVRQQKVQNGMAWTVQTGRGGVTQWVVPRRAKPFVLDANGRILGLARQDTGAVMPLDARLRWVDLTAPERDAALAAQIDPSMAGA